MVVKLASRAGSWYNKPINIVVSEGARNTSQTVINLYRRFIMDTLPPHEQDSNTTFIYALLDPETKEIRYVGKSNNPQLRLRMHLKEKGPSYKNRWIQSLVNKNLLPEILLLEEVPVSRWQQRECYWIAYYRDTGCALVNGTDGGDGVHGMRHTIEARAKISTASKGNKHSLGRKMSPEEIARRSARMQGHSVHPDTGEKIAASKRGKPRSPETIAKVSASLTGRKMPEEQVAKMRGRKQSRESQAKRSASLKLALSTPEAREKKSQVAKGRVMSEVTREKMRVINTGRKHTQEQREANRERALRMGIKPPSRKGIPMPPEAATKRLETIALRNQEKIQRQYILGDEIRLAHKDGATYDQLMERYKISRSQVSRIVRGKSWKGDNT